MNIASRVLSALAGQGGLRRAEVLARGGEPERDGMRSGVPAEGGSWVPMGTSGKGLTVLQGRNRLIGV